MSELNDYMKKRVEKYESGDGIFFTSDTHFGHTNIIRFCNRPFKDAEEMNNTLIDNWNSVVGKNDIVYHLGDFAFGSQTLWNNMLDRLNGHIHLIIGNHDMKNLKQGCIDRFESVSFQKQIYIEGKCIYLNHFPFLCYAGSYRYENPVWQIFGHVHSQDAFYDIESITDQEVKEILGQDANRLQYLFPTQYDVGVDKNNFTPINYYEVKAKIEEQINKSKNN